MGIQIHSTKDYKQAVLMLQAGVIGKVKEVHSWCPKSWGDPNPQPQREDPLPKGFDWDLWLGVCAWRPFIGQGYYHPGNWRNRLDFGTGTLGDMGCHLFDPVFTALELTAPISVRSEGPAPNQWNWPVNSRIQFVFPATRFTAGASLPVTWYDGDQKPPAEIRALAEGDDLPRTGSIFAGTHGTLVLPHFAPPLLYPDAKFSDRKRLEVPGDDHWREFVLASLGRARTSTPFDYSGPLTEAVLLGTIASRFPQTTLNWNAATMQFSESAANPFLRRVYRPGWSVKI
jgi:predicted dehydrogenase